MSATTAIEWTDRTWNPLRGCTKVSPGCDNCYAMGIAHRFSKAGFPFEGLTRVIGGRGQWNGKMRMVPEALLEPIGWSKAQRVFVNSMSDLFHEGVPFQFIADVFAVMACTCRHTYQVLTKRPERALAWFDWLDDENDKLGYSLPCRGSTYPNGYPESVDIVKVYPAWKPWRPGRGGYDNCGPRWPCDNVWIGVSVEDRQHGLPRIDQLRKVPAVVRFLSIEPLLEDLGEIDLLGIHWVIVGGESGHGARPFDIAWARSIVTQCAAAGVPCFVKQFGAAPYERSFGEIAPISFNDRKGGDWTEWPEDLRVRQFPPSANHHWIERAA